MPIPSRGIREHLMASNSEFQQLAREHSGYEAQLEQLTESPYLSSEDLLLQIELKKRKLRVKDAMEQMIASHGRELTTR